MNTLLLSARRDLRLHLRRKSEILTVLFFFIVVATLFPLGIGAEPKLLQRIGPGIVWVAALLASLLALPRLFEADYRDGTLEQMLLAPRSFTALACGKVLAHWIGNCLPLALLAPVLGAQYALEGESLWLLLLTLLLGTPVLSLIGAVGAALTLGLRGGAALVALLVLPLYVPVLVFGAGAIEAQQAGMGYSGHLSLLAALLFASLAAAPWAINAALRIALE